MATERSELRDAVAPTADDTQLARQSTAVLASLLARANTPSIRLRVQPDDKPEEAITIPAAAFRLLAEVLGEMAKGNAVTLIPIDSELTTQQAADLIKVSRPFLIEQLEKGIIPFRKVGKHRRVLFHDLMAYKETMDRNRLKALEELSALDQELGLGYQP